MDTIAKNTSSDDIATPDDIATHNAAMEAYKDGEYVLHDDV